MIDLVGKYMFFSQSKIYAPISLSRVLPTAKSRIGHSIFEEMSKLYQDQSCKT